MEKNEDDEFLGYTVGKKHVCRYCISNREESKATSSQSLFRSEVELDMLCDRCGVKLTDQDE